MLIDYTTSDSALAAVSAIIRGSSQQSITNHVSLLYEPFVGQ